MTMEAPGDPDVSLGLHQVHAIAQDPRQRDVHLGQEAEVHAASAAAGTGKHW